MDIRQTAITKTDHRNTYGVKSSCDLYRTINGEHYICWTSCSTKALVAAYRTAGIRCCRRGVELFVHHADVNRAELVDRQLETVAASPIVAMI